MKFSAVIAVLIGALSFTTAYAAPHKAAHAAHASKAAHHAAAKATGHHSKAGKAKKVAAPTAHGKHGKHGKALKAVAAKRHHGGRHHVAAVVVSDAELAADMALASAQFNASEGSDAKAVTETAESGEVPYANAINSEEEAARIDRERVYDGLLPGDGYTVTMDSFPDQNGSTECVQLIKSLLDAPRTIFWKEGRKLREHFPHISPGTAIATFVKGQYPQHGRTGMHAAIFVRATQAGIFVLDQFRGRVAVTERFIPWNSPNSRKRSNNAATYSTIRW